MERVGAWFSSTSLGSAVPLLAPPLRVDSHLRLPPPLHGDLCLSALIHSNLHLGWSWEGPFHNTIAQTTVDINLTAFEGLIFGCPHPGRCGMQPVVGNEVAELTFCLLPADDDG
ncbi:Os03g0690700 [Oryza sativa Japonica Group]|uniref:Os03g0690700 protein n=1 Tax=Oryza sativa subsp. japonica TaxID=39947 RepID=A0A0P0W277_ORYSJ|nr:hypothetical protein EE612_019790 [Oryza sativa]BAS85842.1 Os03g0690700 [Oryza sativa Japonica Group]